MNILKDQVAVVTGGCRGIGKSIVERLASEGARVFALDYSLPESLESFIEQEDLRSSISYFKIDVSDEESVNTAFAHVMNQAGRIDILVNNAGITRDNLMLRMNTADWDAVINTNLRGAFLCSKAVTKPMMSQRNGRIVNISSIVGVFGNAGQANYSASKAGMIGLTKSLAQEFGSRNILVNCIAPGYVITPMTEKLNEEQKQAFLQHIPLKRGAVAADIANTVFFFCSPDSSYITGQVLLVDGGLSL